MKRFEKILVTGCNGQVGWELRRTLSPLGSVVAVDHAHCDFSETAEVVKFLEREKPSLVVNPAAYTAVDNAEDDKEVAYKVNVEAPAAIARWCKQNGAPLIHFSTDYVFAGDRERPYIETDESGPLGVYGLTKLQGEQAIAASGCAHFIFRTSWVYASRGKNFLLTILRLAREREELRVLADQFGAPTWARHLAEATAAVCAQAQGNSEFFQTRSGIYHMTNAGRTHWNAFAKAIIEGRRAVETLKCQRVVEIATSDYPTKAVRPKYSSLSNAKLRETFGLELPDWQEALAQCLEELSTRT